MRRPVLLGETTGERTFQCRVLVPEDATWTLSFADPVQPSLSAPALNSFVIARGVKSVVLHRDDLPFAPYPYEALLVLDNGSGTVDWPIFVLPHVDAAWPTPESEG